MWSGPVGAVDADQPPSDLLRTHFTTDDSLPGSVAENMVQTHDGFLWLIINGNNLVRFDGKAFSTFSNPRPNVLAVAPDGDLWVGTVQELIRVPASSFNQFTLTGLVSYRPVPGKASHVTCLRFDRSGKLWVGTTRGLFRYDGGEQFTPLGPRVATRKIQEAPDGHILVSTEKGLIEYTSTAEVMHPQLPAQLGIQDGDIFDVLKDRHGNTWYCTGLGVARETNGRIEQLGTYDRSKHPAYHAVEDADGTIWIGKDNGLFRATPTGLEQVTSGSQIRSLYSDRDGSLWVGTNGDGLYRFKKRAIRIFTTADGLPNDVIMSVLATRDGSIWAGANCGGIARFDGTRFHTYSEKDGLKNSCVFALAEDANRDLWVGTYGGGAFRYRNGSFTQYSKPEGLANEVVVGILPARDGSLWFATDGGLSRLRNGEFRTFTRADGLSANALFRVFEDQAGTIWIGSRQGVDRMVGDRFEKVASIPTAWAIPFGQDREGGLFVEYEETGESVVRRIAGDRIDTFHKMSASDMVETERGEIWFGGNPIGRIQPGNFTYARPRDEPLDVEHFSIADGLVTAEATGPSPSVALGRDGKLWIATLKGLALFDLNRLSVTNAKPTIYLTDITIGRNTERAGREVVLPPGTNHVEIHFSAVEISAPEKIRLQYRLDGVDSEWLDAANATAIYSYVPVGTHALHIRACNRNGVWDRQGVVFYVTHKPFFYQTRWFIAAMVALGVLLVILTYRLRVAAISRQMSARFDERLAERTRVARELHDTLLQSVQGSKMVADHALKNSADHTRAIRALEQLSTWLAQATEEGRAALQSLRASTTERNDLAEALRRAIDECGRESSAEIFFSVNGDFREIHPVVRDEIYRIGYEAIRNACAHSGTDRLEVTLDYAHDLTLRISDNGIGIDSEVAAKGKEGHFGLPGMRERAERIGSKFNLASAPDSGTVITLVVPGRLAFRTARRGWFARLKSSFSHH